jgi:hypothetical protein
VKSRLVGITSIAMWSASLINFLSGDDHRPHSR